MDVEHIPDENKLYRRIHPEQLKPNGEISTAAFSGDETSVDWEKYTTPQQALNGYPNYHLASILALIPRQKYLVVKHDPIQTNLAHSLVIGRKTQSIKRFLRKNSTLIIKASTVNNL